MKYVDPIVKETQVKVDKPGVTGMVGAGRGGRAGCDRGTHVLIFRMRKTMNFLRCRVN